MISIYFVRSPILSGVQDLSWTFIESGVQDLSWTSTYSLAPPLALGCLLGAFLCRRHFQSCQPRRGWM